MTIIKMYSKSIYVVLVAFLLVSTAAKKVNRGRRQKPDEEDNTPQPSVVSYSTFGFNDVGAYDGFVPSSPGYSSYLSSISQDPPVRLYAPAFPSAQDNTAPNGNLEPQPLESYTIGSDGSQASVIQYQNFVNSQSHGNSDQGSRVGSDTFGSNGDDYNSPIYGAKLHSRNRNRFTIQNNNTESSYYNSAPSSPNDDRQVSMHDAQPTQETKPSAFGEISSSKFQNNYNFAPTYPSTNLENYGTPEPISTSHLFPKVVDFTKIKPFYPTSIENKYISASTGPSSFKSFDMSYNPPTGHENNNEDTESVKFSALKASFKSSPHSKNNINHIETETIKPVHEDVDESDNAYGRNQNMFKSTKHNAEFKDQFKHKPWTSNNNNNSITSSAPKPRNPFKGYEYSTDHSNASFKLEYDPNRKKPFNANNEELQPASSNVIGASSFQFHDDYSSFNKKPETKNPFEDEFPESFQFSKNKPSEYLEQFKKFYNPPSSASTTQWGSIFDTSEFSYKQQPKKPQYGEINDEVVHIPKRQQGYRFNQEKFFEPNEFSSHSYRPHKQSRPTYEWNKEVSSNNNKYKSEEDLLGLRTRDTSNSYLPTYKQTENSVLEDNDYKKLVDKWRQSYWKSKYRDSIYHDIEGYPSETKSSTMHVPVPKPYPIEIPHPVIVPVPQPYPVRVPVPKPVAVPVIQELTVPVERPVPYPVIKNVPYPIEKPVPYPVVKKVPVPVVKPYPVPVPHVRPLFHHSKPPREDVDEVEEDDYVPRPETSKKVPYAKRPSKSGRPTRSRRPSRTTYYERTRRRSPTSKSANRAPAQPRPTHSKRPSAPPDHRPHRHHDYEPEEYDRDPDYVAYCKRTGKC